MVHLMVGRMLLNTNKRKRIYLDVSQLSVKTSHHSVANMHLFNA